VKLNRLIDDNEYREQCQQIHAPNGQIMELNQKLLPVYDFKEASMRLCQDHEPVI